MVKNIFIDVESKVKEEIGRKLVELGLERDKYRLGYIDVAFIEKRS